MRQPVASRREVSASTAIPPHSQRARRRRALGQALCQTSKPTPASTAQKSAGRDHVLGGEAQETDERELQEPAVERSVSTQGGEDEQHEGGRGDGARPSTGRKAERHQHRRGKAEIEADQQRFARFE